MSDRKFEVFANSANDMNDHSYIVHVYQTDKWKKITET